MKIDNQTTTKFPKNILQRISQQTGIPLNNNIFSGALRLHHIISVKNCNPNGDPNSNGPRLDSRGHGLISPFAIKAIVRRIFEDSGNKILLNSTKKTIEEEVADAGFTDVSPQPASKAKDKKVKEEEDKQSRRKFREDQKISTQKVTDTFMDVRMFGFPLGTIEGIKNYSVVKGPIVMEWYTSSHPVIIREDGTWRNKFSKIESNKEGAASKKQKDDENDSEENSSADSNTKGSQRGTGYNVEFGLYQSNHYIFGSQAKKTKLSNLDVLSYIAALTRIKWHSSQTSSGRSNYRLYFKYCPNVLMGEPNLLGDEDGAVLPDYAQDDFFVENLRDVTITLKPEKGCSSPSSVNDVEIYSDDFHLLDLSVNS